MKATAQNIGRLVGVDAIVRKATRTTGKNGAGNPQRYLRREWLPLRRTGWVVGFTERHEGTIYFRDWCCDDATGDAPATPFWNYLEVDRRVPVVRVLFWPTEAPVLVLHDDLVEPAAPEHFQTYEARVRRQKEEPR